MDTDIKPVAPAENPESQTQPMPEMELPAPPVEPEMPTEEAVEVALPPEPAPAEISQDAPVEQPATDVASPEQPQEAPAEPSAINPTPVDAYAEPDTPTQGVQAAPLSEEKPAEPTENTAPEVAKKPAPAAPKPQSTVPVGAITFAIILFVALSAAATYVYLRG